MFIMDYTNFRALTASLEVLIPHITRPSNTSKLSEKVESFLYSLKIPLNFINNKYEKYIR